MQAKKNKKAAVEEKTQKENQKKQKTLREKLCRAIKK